MRWIACDTENFIYIDGEKKTTEELEKWSLSNEESYIRSHAEVKVWAWLSYGRDGFQNFRTFTDFCDYLYKEKIDQGWFLNAKFDFAQIDWEVLSDEEKWTFCDSNEKEKPEGWWWNDLHGAQGERYIFTIGRGEWSIKFYDILNLIKGSLKNLLEEFDVRDEKNEPIRKLETDYQNPDNPDYLVNDVKGLYFLVKKINEKMVDLFNCSLLEDKPYAITASGLAKKIFLLRYYTKRKNRHGTESELYPTAKKVFQKIHGTGSVNTDLFWRKGNLYRGGLVIVNPYLCGKLLDKPSVRIDCNSMYPAQIAGMPEITGHAVVSTKTPWEDSVEVVDLQMVCMQLKSGMIPCFTDPEKNKMVPHFEKICEKDEHFFIFREELNELEKWYELDYSGSSIFFKTRKNKALADFVDDFYALKAQAKKDHQPITQAFAKLMLNGLGGKFAENPNKDITHRILRAGACRLDHDGTEETPSVIMDVVQGALMTSMARTYLLSSARQACKNVAEDLFYTDTDSIHGVLDLEKIEVDDFRLGAWKKEADVVVAKFLAPKTYLEIEKDGTITVHAKGCPQKALNELFHIDERDKTDYSVKELDRLFSAGQTVNTLLAMNIKGGKGLFLREKHICRPDNFLMAKDFIFEP